MSRPDASVSTSLPSIRCSPLTASSFLFRSKPTTTSRTSSLRPRARAPPPRCKPRHAFRLASPASSSPTPHISRARSLRIPRASMSSSLFWPSRRSSGGSSLLQISTGSPPARRRAKAGRSSSTFAPTPTGTTPSHPSAPRPRTSGPGCSTSSTDCHLPPNRFPERGCCSRDADLLDQVALRRLDGHPPRLEGGHAAVELIRLAGHLEQHPAVITRHVGAADVGHDLELPPELVDHRFLDQRRAEYQLEPAAPHEPGV